MEWVETTGRTVEEAKDAALDQLGVDEQDAEFEILEEPRTGMFGRLKGEARVRARVAPRAQRPKQERRDKRRKPQGKAAGGRSGASAKPAAEPKPADPKPTRAAAKAATGGTDTPADADAGSDPVSTTRSGGARRGGGRKGGTAPGGDAPSADRADPAQADQDDSAQHPAPAGKGKKPNMDAPVTVEEQAEMMEGFLEGLLESFGAQGQVATVRIDDETIELQVTGDDLGLLIGPKGATLQSVQDLARTVVQRRLPGPHEGRVRIDVSGYRQKRREALERFVTQVANDVLASGERKALEPMGAADRKVVHDTVNGIDGVETSSEGFEPDRWVVILPES